MTTTTISPLARDQFTDDTCEVCGCDEKVTHAVSEEGRVTAWVCEGCARSGAAGAAWDPWPDDGIGMPYHDTYAEKYGTR